MNIGNIIAVTVLLLYVLDIIFYCMCDYQYKITLGWKRFLPFSGIYMFFADASIRNKIIYLMQRAEQSRVCLIVFFAIFMKIMMHFNGFQDTILIGIAIIIGNLSYTELNQPK